jgi:hypothetical protein
MLKHVGLCEMVQYVMLDEKQIARKETERAVRQHTER